MERIKKVFIPFSFCVSAALLLLTSGCAEYLHFANTIPGEYNLGGVSKIAAVGLNTVPDDPVIGVYSVDETTKKLVEDMVATVFFKGQMYKIADLDAEKLIAESGEAGMIKLAQRFDAVMCGRVWWKVSPEYKNIHPVVHTLEKWRNEKYLAARTNKGQPIYATAHLTEKMTDVMAEHKFRASNAALMLSITVYRLDHNGKLEKIVKDFAVADQSYLIDNGDFTTVYSLHDKVGKSLLERINEQGEDKDAKEKKAQAEKAGYINDDQNASTIPTALQTKIMLAQKLANVLGGKMNPTNIQIDVEIDFSIDKKLIEAMKAGKYDEVEKALVTAIRKKVGNYIYDRIGSLSGYDKEDIEVAKDPSGINKDNEEKYVNNAIDDLEDELYALAVCEEACKKYDYALANYRALLKFSAKEKYARGISRCLVSLDIADKLQSQHKDVKKATKKSSMK